MRWGEKTKKWAEGNGVMGTVIKGGGPLISLKRHESRKTFGAINTIEHRSDIHWRKVFFFH